MNSTGDHGDTILTLPVDDAAGRRVERLRDYVVAHGPLPAHATAGPEGQWATRMSSALRVAHRQGRLDSRHVAALEALPGWSWDPCARSEARGLAALRRYVAQHGHARVPFSYTDPRDGLPLGVWVRVQRERRAKLPVARVAALEALPGWAWRPLVARDRLLLDALARYAAQHGHTWMAQAYIDARGFPLGKRVGELRRAYASDRAHPPRLAGELEAVPGWTWDGLGSQHLPTLDALRAFVAREGHALVPSTWPEGDVPLGLWILQRRHEHRTGRRRIAPALTTFLEALPYWSWDLDGQQTQRFVALLAFARQHGHVDIPRRGRLADAGLAYWVDQMRTRHAQGRLSGDATALLERIPGWRWSVAARPQAQAAVIDGGLENQTARWRPRVFAGRWMTTDSSPS